MSASVPIWNRLARFAATGGVAFGLNLSMTVGLHELLGSSEELAFAIALLTVFIFSFFACRYYIFFEARGSIRRQLTLFAASSLGFRCAEYLGFLLLHSMLGVAYVAAVVIILGLSFVTKFVFYRTVVFIDVPGP